MFGTLQGPWAFVFYQVSTKLLWFGRDYFGRRSLLLRKNSETFELSSVGKRCENKVGGWSEIPAHGLYCINTLDESFTVKCYPWHSITRPSFTKLDVMLSFDKDTPSLSLDKSIYQMKPICTSVEYFNQSVTDIPSFLIFENDQAISTVEKLVRICDEQKIWDLVKEFITVLESAVQKRVENVPLRLGAKSSVGVLFSGGVDCTVIALLADKYIPLDQPIDLLNVAFQNHTKNEMLKQFDVPDRRTGRAAVDELRKVCPNRRWNFVEIDVTIEELKSERKKKIADLTHPLVSVLDDSIACALWFASKGNGKIFCNSAPDEHHVCRAKVLLCGMGADEQLAGYSRHRTAYKRGGWGGLVLEVQMEVERISQRNLGRDNRIIADHGREARLPYLDENVISFLNSMPMYYKADLRYDRGLGEKLLLRASAYVLGLRDTAVLPKRAIQFGSRIAKVECKKEKASDICKRLLP